MYIKVRLFQKMRFFEIGRGVGRFFGLLMGMGLLPCPRSRKFSQPPTPLFKKVKKLEQTHFYLYSALPNT